MEREQANDNIPTGAVELQVTSLTVLNMAKTTPFEIKDGIEASDDIRLRYRYLDLRRPEMLSNFKLRDSNSQYSQLLGRLRIY